MSTMPLFHEVPPDQMTWRARLYLMIAASRHLLTGASTLLIAHDYEGSSFTIVKAVFPLWLWGVLFLLGGAHLLYSAGVARETPARIALGVSAVVTSVWAAGFLLAWHQGVSSPLGGILFGALTLKDLIVCRQPMRSPFEPILKEYAKKPPGG